MDESTLKIFIGFDDKEAVVFHTCVQSIINTCKVPVSLHPLHLKMFKNYRETHNDGSNNFIYSRFLVPYLNNFKGKALFLDGDMIVNEDLGHLFNEFDEKYAVQVVKHDYKTKFPIKYLGHKNDDYPKKNWSSVILFNCSHPKNKILTPKLIETAKGSYLHRFSWLKEEEVGEISKEWNYLVLEYPETKNAKIFHYTVGAPCFDEFDYGIEAKIWNNTYLKSQTGFDNNLTDSKIINHRK